MTTTETVQSRIPAGTYVLDPVHSSASFAVEYSGISMFETGFGEIEASLDISGEEISLSGAAAVESIDVDLPDLKQHLMSEEFFDAERHPRVEFRSTEVRLEGDDEVTVRGELSIAGSSREVEARGTLRGPVTGLSGQERVAIELRSQVDRTEFGLDWNAELPSGGQALADEVEIRVALQLDASEA